MNVMMGTCCFDRIRYCELFGQDEDIGEKNKERRFENTEWAGEEMAMGEWQESRLAGIK